jgi:peptidoglycan biosynthesis protein MviN/MurJ (putative lipid II flippase)
MAPFFALLDTRTPLRNTIYGVVANLLLLPAAVGGLALVGGRPVIGVAIAFSLAVYVNVAHGAYRVRAIVVGVGVAGLAVMGGVLGLFSIGRLRRAADGTEVPLR